MFPRGTLKVHSNTAISIKFLVYLETNWTLFDCGFQKNVELKNGGLYDITETLQKPVKMSTSDFMCQKCSQSFFRKQHLEMHTKYKHPEVEVDSLDKSTSALNIESVDLYVQQEARPPRQEKEHPANHHGRNKRSRNKHLTFWIISPVLGINGKKLQMPNKYRIYPCIMRTFFFRNLKFKIYTVHYTRNLLFIATLICIHANARERTINLNLIGCC